MHRDSRTRKPALDGIFRYQQAPLHGSRTEILFPGRARPPSRDRHTPRRPMSRPDPAAPSYDGLVTAQPAEPLGQHDVIHLGGETAVVVPMDEYRRFRALERLASPGELEAAEADAVLEAHREWVAAGRPGAVSHDEAMAELLGGSP